MDNFESMKSFMICDLINTMEDNFTIIAVNNEYGYEVNYNIVKAAVEYDLNGNGLAKLYIQPVKKNKEESALG